MPIEGKLLAFCQRCMVYGSGGLIINHEAVERGYLSPNPFFNAGGLITGRPSVVDHTQVIQYRIMRKWFTHVPLSEYTEPYGSLGGREFSTRKFHQIVKNNPSTLAEMRNNITMDEARAISFVRPGWLYGYNVAVPVIPDAAPQAPAGEGPNN